jgi:hypothetical protein
MSVKATARRLHFERDGVITDVVGPAQTRDEPLGEGVVEGGEVEGPAAISED